jgi:hypothetical protein
MRVLLAGASGAIGTGHSPDSFAETNRLRTEGTDTLLAAAPHVITVEERRHS